MLINKEFEIRGRELKTSKKGNEYIIANLEDTETGQPYSLYDPDATRYEYYKRGQEANFTLKLTYGYGQWNLQVADFKYVDEN